MMRNFLWLPLALVIMSCVEPKTPEQERAEFKALWVATEQCASHVAGGGADIAELQKAGFERLYDLNGSTRYGYGNESLWLSQTPGERCSLKLENRDADQQNLFYKSLQLDLLKRGYRRTSPSERGTRESMWSNGQRHLRLTGEIRGAGHAIITLSAN